MLSTERSHSILHFISCGFNKDLDFRRIILTCDNESSTKALQDSVIHACVGVEVIPEGPSEGDHIANGRVEMAVGEVKRQCRTLRISTYRKLQFITQLASSFSNASHEQDENWQIRKDV